MRFPLSRPEQGGRLVRQISLGMVVILLLTMTLALQIIHRYTVSVLSERDERIAFDQFEGAQSRINEIFDSLYANINLLLYDRDVLAIAREHKTSMDYSYYSLVKSTYVRLVNMTLNANYIESIYIYINDNVVISTDITNSVSSYSAQSIPILKSGFYQDVCKEVFRIGYSTGYQETDFHAYKAYEPAGSPLITLACASDNSWSNGKRVIMVNINAQMIAGLLESYFGEGSIACLLDANGSLLCATDAAAQTDFFSALALSEDGENRGRRPVTLGGAEGQAAYLRSGDRGFTIVKYIPADENIKDANTLGFVFFTAFFLCSAVSLILVRSWIRRCLKPIDAICAKMEELEVGKLGVQVSLAPKNELGNVIRHFNRMSRSLAEMDEVKRQTEKSLRIQELSALRAQLNPHFIFNTLNMMKWMAVAHQADDLEECLVALAEILYPIFRENAETIPLKQEFNCLQKYLFILSHRFGSQVNLHIALREELETVPVPRLIIQPIVENCIRHGCYNDGRALTVNVSAQAKDGVLEVSVADDGRGISREKLEQLSASIRSNDSGDGEDGQHIGLSNVHRRIVLQYGSAYGLDIQSEPGRGTVVRIRLPLP